MANLTLRKKNDDAEFKSFCSQQVSKSVTRFSEYPAQHTAAGKSVVRRLQSLERLMGVESKIAATISSCS